MARRKGGGSENITFAKGQVSPKGVALWAYLSEPSEGKDGIKPAYKVSIFFDPADEAFQKFEKIIAAAMKQYGSTETSPIKAADDYTVKYVTDNNIKGVKAGQPYVTFRTAEGPVPVVGLDGQATNQEVWSGDIARTQFNIVGWSMMKRRGVSCFLSGVQLLKTSREGFLSTSKLGAVEGMENEGGFQPQSDKSLEELLSG